MTKLNMVPDFAGDNSAAKGAEVTDTSVKPIGEEPLVKERETPTEPPAEVEEKPAEESNVSKGDDTGQLEKDKALAGLQAERDKLLAEIRDLRGTRREVKKDELAQVDKKVEDLEGVHPDDVKLIEKVLRKKGYVTRDEAQGMAYKATQDEKLNEFLEKYPEYKPENDTSDVNWNALQRALAIYAKPSDPRRWGEVLERAHKDIARVPSDRTLEVKKQTVKTAGVGGSGTQGSSPTKKFSPERRTMLLQGGFSEEDIVNMESRL